MPCQLLLDDVSVPIKSILATVSVNRVFPFTSVNPPNETVNTSGKEVVFHAVKIGCKLTISKAVP